MSIKRRRNIVMRSWERAKVEEIEGERLCLIEVAQGWEVALREDDLENMLRLFRQNRELAGGTSCAASSAEE